MRREKFGSLLKIPCVLHRLLLSVWKFSVSLPSLNLNVVWRLLLSPTRISDLIFDSLYTKFSCFRKKAGEFKRAMQLYDSTRRCCSTFYINLLTDLNWWMLIAGCVYVYSQFMNLYEGVASFFSFKFVLFKSVWW